MAEHLALAISTAPQPVKVLGASAPSTTAHHSPDGVTNRVVPNGEDSGHSDNAFALLKALVIAWDADQDEEFDEALVAARQALGFTLAEDPDGAR